MNVGILGSGFIVPVFIQNAQNVEGYHIRGLWARNLEKAKAFEDRADYVTDDLDKLLSDEEIDVIYVALPNGLHYQYAKKALEAGKNALCEKPFTVTSAQAQELFDLASSKGLIIYEAIMTIHSPNFLAAKENLSKLGDIKLVDCNFSQYSRRYERFKNGITLPAFDKDLAGGALLDLGVYNVHLICGLFGEPQNVCYFANVENGVDTSGVLVLDYGSFKAVSIQGKDCSADSHVFIEGDKGLIKSNSTASRIAHMEVTTRSGESLVYDCGPDSEFTGMSNELVEFKRVLDEKDYKAVKEKNDYTMVVVRTLEKALKSAGLNY